MKKGDYGDPNSLYLSLSARSLNSSSSCVSISHSTAFSEKARYEAIIDTRAKQYINLLSKGILTKCGVDTEDYEYKQSCQQEALILTNYLDHNSKVYQLITNDKEYNYIERSIIKEANNCKSQLKLSSTVERANASIFPLTKSVPKDLRPYFQLSNDEYEFNCYGVELVYKQSVDDIINRIASTALQESIQGSQDEEIQSISEHEEGNASQKNSIPESKEDLMSIIEQLKTFLKQKDTIIGQQAEQIGDLRANVQELRQDKLDLREHISGLQQSQYKQLDSIIGLGASQTLEEVNYSQLSGTSDDLSISSFEIF